MINYFLNEQEGLTSSKRKLIKKQFLTHRKYNPFHLDCQFTKRKLCYCKRHPIQGLTPAQRDHLWESSYRKAADFFDQKSEELEMRSEGDKNRQQSRRQDEEQKKDDKMPRDESKQREERDAKILFQNSIRKIRALGKEQLIRFMRERIIKNRACIADNDGFMSFNQF